MVLFKSRAYPKLRDNENAMATPPYTYTSLRGNSSIRVLVLEPASKHDAPLVAKLQHGKIPHQDADFKEEYHPNDNGLGRSKSFGASKQLLYEAVSYAWNDEGPLVPLEIHGSASFGTVWIRPNVETMLRYLRLPDQQRCLWIDAVCINQEDADEHAIQVAHMGEIYSQAQTVVIWLGPPTDAHSRVDVFFNDLVLHADEEDSEERRVTWRRMRHLLDRDWFKRRWIIQETVLAKYATMRCGNYNIDFMTFARSVWLISQRQSHSRSPVPETVGKLWMMYRLRSSLIPTNRVDGLRLLVEFASAQCSDDRDRVYALNGLTDVQAPVSYTESVKKIYMNYARMHILEHGNLAILNCGGAFRSTDSTIPTWCPDWRSLPGYTPLVTNLAPLKLADPKMNEWPAATIKEKEERATLCINGVKLGQITKVGYGAGDPVWGGDVLRLLQDWYAVYERNPTKSSRRRELQDTSADQFIATISLGTIQKQANAFGPSRPQSANSFPTDGMSRVTGILAHLICEDRDMNTDAPWKTSDQAKMQAAAAKISEGLKDALKSLAHGPPTAIFDPRPDLSLDYPPPNEKTHSRNLAPAELTEILCRTIAGRTCFWSSDGSFGLGPANMEPGDVVVAIPTCPTPYVLRPKSSRSPLALLKSLGSSTSNDDEVYKLVGDCYIHSFDAVETFEDGKTVKRIQLV
ncbi:hypothetical protein NX059_002768 [Plenodomus lindquistii]|nr:hypothetical protein NX059_002768 [Plenodomus lindquistii]